MKRVQLDELVDDHKLSLRVSGWLEQGDPMLCAVFLLLEWTAAVEQSALLRSGSMFVRAERVNSQQESSLDLLRYMKAVYANGNADKRPLLPLPPVLAINATADCTAQEAISAISKHLKLDAAQLSRPCPVLDHMHDIQALLARQDLSHVNREKALERILRHYLPKLVINKDAIARFVRAEPEAVVEEVIVEHHNVIGVDGMQSPKTRMHTVKELFRHGSSSDLRSEPDSASSSRRNLTRPVSMASLRSQARTSSAQDLELDEPAKPFSNLKQVDAEATTTDLPDTTNQLSRFEKRKLIARSQKLSHVLGTPLDETSLPIVMYDDLAPLDRTVSPASSSLLSPKCGCSRDWRKMSIPGQPDYYFEEFAPPVEAIKQSRQFTALGRTPSVVRDERRRKINKLHRLLGEHVPSELALNDAPGRVSVGAAQPLARSKSSIGTVWDKLVHKRNHSSSPLNNDSNEPHHVSQPPEQAAARSIKPVDGLNKARKLEQMFGDLPPASLYLPRPAHRRSKSHQDVDPKHRERSWSNRTMSSYRSSIVSLTFLADHDPDALARLANDYARRSNEELVTSSSLPDSAKTFHSIESTSSSSAAALVQSPIDLSDSDVELDRNGQVKGHVRNVLSPETVYSSASSARQVVSPISPVESSSPDVVSPSLSADLKTHRRSASLDRLQSQTAKRAQKLASFFGTTKGHVWNVLLDDLQNAIEEEAEVDEEERADVLAAVARLRQHTVVP